MEEALTERLLEYVKRGKMINPKTRIVDSESALSFKELFSLDAKLINDLREVPEAYPYSVDEYIDRAMEYFPAYGLSFYLDDIATITDGELDEVTNRYTFTIALYKSVNQYYKENGLVENGTKAYQLDFVYSLKMDELESARINLIRRSALDETKPADLYTKLFDLSFGVGYGLASYDETFMDMDAQKDKFTLNPGLNLNIGLSAYTNGLASKTSPNKRLFLTGGVMGFYQKISAELDNYRTSGPLGNIRASLPGSPQTNIADGSMRMADSVYVKEEQTIIGMRIPVGIGVRLHNKNTSFSMLKIQYAPSFALSTLGSMAGSGKYDMKNDFTIPYNPNTQGNSSYSGNFNTSEGKSYSDTEFAKAYELGKLGFDADPKLETALTHGIMLSGLYFKDFVDDGKTFGVAFGLQYYLPFTGLWNFNDEVADKPFWYSTDEKANYVKHGILTPFVEGAKLSYFGISLNIYYKKTDQP